MKKHSLIRVFLALFVITLASCDTEPVDPVISEQNQNPTNPTNPGGGGEGSGETEPTDGDYWPMAVNNQWQFESTEPENDQPMKIIGTETIGGINYYRMNYAFQNSGNEEVSGTSVIHIRKDGQTYYQRASVIMPDENGVQITVTPFELPVLKADVVVGDTWTASIVQETSYYAPDFPIQIPPSYNHIELTGTMLEKGISVTVNGITYTDVIKIKAVQEISIEMQGIELPGTSVTSTVWFAKGVGPIKTEATGMNGAFVSSKNLVSYTLY